MIERLVLRLPAEAGDGTVVAAAIGNAGDSELWVCGSGEIGEDRIVRNVFNQARAEDRRGNAKAEVADGRFGGKIGLASSTATPARQIARQS